MTTRTVRTKKELKEAIKDNIDTIIVSEKLKKELRNVVKLMKMPPKKRNAIIGFLGAGGVAVVAAAAAAPATMGFSSIAGMSAIAVFATTSGVSVPIVVAIILLCVAVGIPSVISLLRMYDITDDEVEFEIGGVRFRRKTSYRSK